MSRTVEVLQVDTFTTVPFAGNPACVVPDAAGLSDGTMRAIAAELAVPATAFVSPATRPGAAWDLRWFTPSGAELSLCGHGTVAATHVLAEWGRLADGRVAFATPQRLVGATREGSTIWFEPDLPTVVPEREPLGPVLDALGVAPDRVATWACPARTSEGDLLIPVVGLDVLRALAPDLGRLARICRERELRGVCLTATETLEAASLTHTRFFAPHVGIPEDPSTGSAHAAMAVWLWEAGALRADAGVATFRGEQGDWIGRPGRLTVSVHVPEGRPASVRVGGPAVTVLTGRMRLP